MTMLSFRVDDAAAGHAQNWAGRLGIDRSVLLRDALRTHLARLDAQADAGRGAAGRFADAERSPADAADGDSADASSEWLGRALDPESRARLEVRAVRRGRTPGAEALAILRASLIAVEPGAGGLGSRIHARFAAVGGVDLGVPLREELPRAPGLR